MSLIEEVTTLAQLPRIVSRERGAAPALIVEDEHLDYQGLERRSNQIANALIRDGITPGDRVALLGKECLNALTLLFGTAKAKAICVSINWRLAADEIAYIISDAKPKLFFVDAGFAGMVESVLDKLETRPAVYTVTGGHADWQAFDTWCADAGDTAPALSYDPESVVVQLYTSGTTGHPKGVQLASRSFFAIAREMHACGDRWIGWTDASVSLVVIPTFHIGGLWWLLRGLALGSTNVVLRSFDPGVVLRAISRHGVTKTCMVPAMIQVVLNEPGCKSTDFSTLETIVYGGSPISSTLLVHAMDTFGCDFCQIYGMTETGNMAVCLRPEDHVGADEQRLRAAGRPLPGVEVGVVDAQGNAVAVGEIGEITIKSPAHMIGYWNRAEATAKTLVDGWIMTGDAGYLDENGYIFINDRIKDMIISAGENIYPAEIENVIRGHPDVADVAVIGVPDDLWGEAVKAIVVRRPSSRVRAQEIVQHSRMYLAEFKVPRSVDFVEQVPRNASGKLLKVQLREPYWRGRERRVN